MPTLPQYNSQRNIQANTPLPLRNEVEARNASKKMGEGISAFGDMWVKAQNDMQTTAVKAGYSEDKATIEATAINDTDINGAENRYKELEKAKQQRLKGISSPALKNQLSFELDHENRLTQIKIGGIYKQKQIFADKLNTETIIQNASKERAEAVASGNQVLVDAKDQEIFKMLQGKAATKMLTPAAAKEYYQAYQEGAVDFDIQSDPATTQTGSLVLKELLKGKEGVYGNLPADKLADKIKDAKINIWRNKNNQTKLVKETNTQGALDLSKALIDNSLTSSTINKMVRSGNIDAKTAAIFNNAIAEKDLTKADSSKTADYLLKLIDDDGKTALDVLNEATRLRGSKDLDDSAYGYVIQEANKKLNREKQGLTGWDKSTQLFKDGAKALSEFSRFLFTDNAEKVLNNMVNKLITRAEASEDPQEAAKIIQKETVLEYHPQALTYPEEGRVVMDANGNKMLIMPDGTLLDMTIKNEGTTKPKRLQGK